jgi:CheY-like chemotaxis protein
MLSGGPDDTVPILLVDDQPANLDALEATLAASGCKFVLARSADEALLALLDQDFAAIVLDVMMPGMSGFELATMIRQRERTRQVPILFLSARWTISRSPSSRRSCAPRSPSSSSCFASAARCRA